MGYSEFLRALFEDGRVIVPAVAPLTEEELRAGDEVLAEYERIVRLEMPGSAPLLVESAGRWAGARMYRACQFAVYRDLGEEEIDQELRGPYREPISPDVHYTVDITFRYLPDVTKFAGSASEQDPLLEYLNQWAHQWPLSSVGMSGIDTVEIEGFAHHASLMRLYVDRIIATGDTTRLSHEGVRQAVRSALGMFPKLAQKLTTALAEYDVQEST